ncbi:uncharacterized protein F5147DRAFT_656199 [Suillus discolor]|uniref:Uncharacterized protein n=1 Tax=Suillus discolor TaxID=1912936 RepID=A0A9P7JQ84_9AGAM|nr:uncharacterized protein F5147DRAFT_656199 [Suillus discolor]KAG2097958.1 hypothetical protein F5147DRAFT_656199 [Suillus discolor]
MTYQVTGQFSQSTRNSCQWQLGHNRNENMRKSAMTYQEKETVQRRYGKRMANEDTKLLLETLLGGDSEFYEGLADLQKDIQRKMQCRVSNSGGDPDVEMLDEKFENAQILGKDVKNLSGAMLKKWYEGGWYELFNSQLGEHPGLVWEEEFHSGIISDTLIISSDESDTSDEEHKVKLKKACGKALQRSTSSAAETKAQISIKRGACTTT